MHGIVVWKKKYSFLHSCYLHDKVTCIMFCFSLLLFFLCVCCALFLIQWTLEFQCHFNTRSCCETENKCTNRNAPTTITFTIVFIQTLTCLTRAMVLWNFWSLLAAFYFHLQRSFYFIFFIFFYSVIQIVFVILFLSNTHIHTHIHKICWF